MKENKLTNKRVIRWKQFNRKGYAAFFSLKKEVNIGVLTVCTLGFANAGALLASFETSIQLRTQESDGIEFADANAWPGEIPAAKVVPVVVPARENIQPAAVGSIRKALKRALARGSTLFRLITDSTGSDLSFLIPTTY